MHDHSFAAEFASEAAKGTPPVAVAAAWFVGFGLETWVVILTLIYLAMQIYWLAWKFVDKWRGEAADASD